MSAWVESEFRLSDRWVRFFARSLIRSDSNYDNLVNRLLNAGFDD